MPTSHLPRAAALTVCLICSTPLLASPLVITDSERPVTTPPGTQIILLDQPATLEVSLSANLPLHPGEAQVLFQQRMTPDLTARISHAHQDVANAWSLGVTKIPAVVVDQRYVVYGEPDVQKALNHISKFMESRP